MLTFYSMVNETGNRNRILEMCKFRFWLVHWIHPCSIEHSYACVMVRHSVTELIAQHQQRTALIPTPYVTSLFVRIGDKRAESCRRFSADAHLAHCHEGSDIDRNTQTKPCPLRGVLCQ